MSTNNTNGAQPGDFFKALADYAKNIQFPWHTPGHCGGRAFRNNPAGQDFYFFFGEPLFLSDLSVSVPELGSLLDHTSPIKEAEDLAAATFGADYTFLVTNGTTTANRMIWQGTVLPTDKVVIDRNCHKSLVYSAIATGVASKDNVSYLWPSRNFHGLIGPITKTTFAGVGAGTKTVTVTNSTYDGLCYKVQNIFDDLTANVAVLHLDEAWFGYAKFDPFYAGRFAMDIQPEASSSTVVFSTQSTHKVLAAFSQTSMLHVKQAPTPGGIFVFDYNRFNESFMMNTSTSPQYGLIASLDVATAMMADDKGKEQVQNTISNSIEFRSEIDKLNAPSPAVPYFQAWQPSNIAGNETRSFQEMLKEYVKKRYAAGKEAKTPLSLNPDDWKLTPDNVYWHGFHDITENDDILLDPTKVTVLTRGLKMTATEEGYEETGGIPASIVAWYLNDGKDAGGSIKQSIVIEKTGIYSFLVLYTIGVEAGQVIATIDGMQSFIDDYELDVPLEIPGADPETGLKTFCEQMHQAMKNGQVAELLKDLFEPGNRAIAEISPAEAYQELIAGRVERVAIEALVDRTAAVQMTPYPPGIPMIMPGEKFNQAIVDYLLYNKNFDSLFPGFQTHVHGLTIENGEYYVLCLTE
ncbi:MAG: aminotransferase class I/II-fold pyridoxal phosphate-dependent enzyme [Okeania sp. SIO3I5]|uniref:aminotransferase class I/II-fold pyridoxal phosphate-dependent enzyme n=1 Tax=Okeania sp. SIO3I5 TaxID=2607805 RepID=UPI0013B6AEE4|nr:aminotransferase class I/II-fold pyridoxal phosphate-dependent enzyme [Okeania sp. SIO3I5]NEQ41088.1 aminotransferase class I/II-fold pyridoxal phosphate-dependent enzyme [Okeania sp. SIO3I5]